MLEFAPLSGVYYIIPIMSMSILIGLALDYDIFLMSRVVEFRRMVSCERVAVARLGVIPERKALAKVKLIIDELKVKFEKSKGIIDYTCH